MKTKDLFSLKLKTKETSNIINLESGAIKSFLDSWTYVHALLELSDNANDAGATRFEVGQYKADNGKYYIIINYNGKAFTYDTLYDYLRIFSYHVALKKDTAGLRGCGRRWAFYTLCNYRNWNIPKTSRVVLYSYNKDEKKIHNGSLTIRFPEQLNKDVVMSESLKCDDWNKWFNNIILIEVENPIRMEEFAEELKVSYPTSTNTKFIINDLIGKFKTEIKPVDMTYAIDMLRDESLWKDIDKGVKQIETKGGTFLLSYGKAPCGKTFKIITSVLKTDFVKEMGERTANGGAKHVYGGLYAFRGNRFIVHGNSKHLGNLIPDRGGCGNCRTIVDLSDDEVANDFGVRTNKSLGIENLENSVKLNPNNTRLEGSSNERRSDKNKSDKTILGVYDYILNSSRLGYKIYCDKYAKKKLDKAIQNIEKQRKLKSKEEVIKEIGEIKAAPIDFATTKMAANNFINSTAFDDLLDKILDELEKMGVEIPCDAHEKIISSLSSASINYQEEWEESLSMV